MRMRGALRRADWLAELQHLLAAALMLGTVAGGVALVVGIAGAPIDVTVPAATALVPGAAVAPGLAGGAVLDPEGGVTLRVERPDAGQVVLFLLTGVPVWALSLTMLLLLWRMVRAARRTDPFTAGVAHRLDVLGWLLIVGGPVVETVAFLATFALAGTLGHPQATLTLMPLLLWVLVGAGMLAVGQVVRRGLALRDELDTVV